MKGILNFNNETWEFQLYDNEGAVIANRNGTVTFSTEHTVQQVIPWIDPFISSDDIEIERDANSIVFYLKNGNMMVTLAKFVKIQAPK